MASLVVVAGGRGEQLKGVRLACRGLRRGVTLGTAGSCRSRREEGKGFRLADRVLIRGMAITRYSEL